MGFALIKLSEGLLISSLRVINSSETPLCCFVFQSKQKTSINVCEREGGEERERQTGTQADRQTGRQADSKMDNYVVFRIEVHIIIGANVISAGYMNFQKYNILSTMDYHINS